ncbi:MAG: hypothetical protein GY906_22795 [bacterium]|nr:hypothetical protein [bacterium]
MNFLNGFKTYLGLGGLVASIILPQLGVDASGVPGVQENLWSVAQGVFGTLGALGVVHKVEKAKESKQHP